MENKNTIELVNRIRVDCLYGKKKHYNAADRKQRANAIITWTNIVFSFFSGSILFATLLDSFPMFATYIAGFLAYITMILTVVQMAINFRVQIDGHRNCATNYLEIAKECDRIFAYYQDGNIDANKLMTKIEELSNRYSKLTRATEAFPTNKKDYKVAKQGFNEGEEQYLNEELN